MANLNVLGHVKASSKAGQDKLASELLDMSKYSLEKEPETLQYVVTVPRDPSNESDVYCIELYEKDSSFHNVHMTCQPVKDMGSLFEAQPDIVLQPAAALPLEPLHVMPMKSTIHSVKDPLVVVATLEYHPQYFDEAVEGWGRVVEESKSEPKTLLYSCLKDPKVKDRVWMIEVYESQEGFDEHCKGVAVTEKLKNEKQRWRVDPDVRYLKLLGGYWSRL